MRIVKDVMKELEQKKQPSNDLSRHEASLFLLLPSLARDAGSQRVSQRLRLQLRFVMNVLIEPGKQKEDNL